MLRYNYTAVSANCSRAWGLSVGVQRYMYGRTELRNYTAGEGFENNKAGIPNGHLPPSSWVLPQSPGSISAYENLRVEITAGLTPGELAPIQGQTQTSITATATIKGIAVLAGAVTPFTELSPQNLANAVWNSEVQDYSTTGTMGKAVKDTKNNTDLIPASL
jgi:hypothetical protein